MKKIVFAFDGSPVTDGNRAQALLDAPRGGMMGQLIDTVELIQ